MYLWDRVVLTYVVYLMKLENGILCVGCVLDLSKITDSPCFLYLSYTGFIILSLQQQFKSNIIYTLEQIALTLFYLIVYQYIIINFHSYMLILVLETKLRHYFWNRLMHIEQTSDKVIYLRN